MCTFDKQPLQPIVLVIGEFMGENKEVAKKSWDKIKENYKDFLKIDDTTSYLLDPVDDYSLKSFIKKINSVKINSDEVLPIAVNGENSDEFKTFLYELLMNFNIISIITCQGSETIIYLRDILKFLNIPILITLASNSDLFEISDCNLQHMLRLVPSNEQQVHWITAILQFELTDGNPLLLNRILEQTGFFFHPNNDAYVRNMFKVIERQLKQVNCDMRNKYYDDTDEAKGKGHKYWVVISYTEGFNKLHQFLVTQDKPDSILLTDGCDQDATRTSITSQNKIRDAEYRLIKYSNEPEAYAKDAHKAVAYSYKILAKKIRSESKQLYFESLTEIIKLKLNDLNDRYKFIDNTSVQNDKIK